jgi:RimJ/RimL family protein N-acetyltransferase
MSDIPDIETERLRMTAFTDRHFDAYAAMLADADSTRWINDGQPLDRMNAWRSMAMLLGHWSLRGFGMWALERRSDDAFIGRVGLMRPEGWPDIELGWMLKPEHRHHGYATEAGTAALQFAWKELRVPRTISLVRVGNEASLGVVRRLHGELVEDIDFLGAPTHVFAYYPPARPHK